MTPDEQSKLPASQDKNIDTGYTELLINFLGKAALLFLVITLISMICRLIIIAIPSPWSMIVIIALVFAMIPSIFTYRLQIKRAAAASQAQAAIFDKINATHIGSAIHVAGHPMLARDQPVVLALKHDTLSVHSYESSSPIASLDLGHLDTVHTVVYDDQRVPHLGVIDSAAQALQLTFDLDGQPCTCLFRSMKDLRPIDWYHAIQQTRLGQSAL
ncbi:MAG: hypothetical protein OEZ02_08745 [Anaerolineae bacterium]|nr:hypothetical protein [Anaerolineae bacterium]